MLCNIKMASLTGNRIRRTLGERTFVVLIYIIMILFTLICLYPFYYIIIYSLSDPQRANQGVFLAPIGFSISAYANILSRPDLPSAFFVSVLRTVFGATLTVIFSSMFAYLVTQKDMLFRRAVYRFVIITMYLSAGLIPWYIVMRTYGLTNNFLLYIIPSAMNAFFVILVKTYIEQLPTSIEESAQIDGAGFFTIFFSIIFPLSMPIVATIAIYAAVGQWNSWVDNYLLVRDSNLQTMQLLLYRYLNEAESISRNFERLAAAGNAPGGSITPLSIRMSITVITVVPIICIYPLLQKYFIKGIMLGAVKG